MKIKTKDCRVASDEAVNLKKWPTRVHPFYTSDEHYKELLAADVKELSSLQRLLYAANSYSLLLIFQAMDAAGKDGTIAHVLTGVNPQGCEVHSFKHPSAEELEHDFLWRTTSRLPARGRIGVFNRSYYEEVLIVRVHPEILRSEGIPDEPKDPSKVWEGRFRSINDLERHLHRSGTVVLKFFLHLSKNEQRKRFLRRIDDPERNWKFGDADMAERKCWGRYMDAYEDCISRTSAKHSPWFVVPADDKRNARLIVSRVVIEKLKELKMRYPVVSAAKRRELLAIRRNLTR
jgi:PPK2 family polyphosphate:nucleotide phosphotransferase